MRNEKLHNLYFISDIVRMIKSSRVTDWELTYIYIYIYIYIWEQGNSFRVFN
jgi:hypothetical protein